MMIVEEEVIMMIMKMWSAKAQNTAREKELYVAYSIINTRIIIKPSWVSVYACLSPSLLNLSP